MRYFLILCVLVSLLSAPAVRAEQEELSLPRFVTLKAGEANIRTGPGLRYQIKWVYNRRGLPLEIIAEFEQWRQVRDMDGDEGWLHRSMLSSERSAVITVKKGNAALHHDADTSSPAVAYAEYGVVVQVKECQKTMCKVSGEDHKGWVEKSQLWGVYPDEVFEE